MTPLKNSKNLAARMGRWSAGHWKTAVFGWLAFVIVAFVIGGAVGQKSIPEEDYGNGQSKSVTYAKPGKYEIECAIHPDMRLVVTVAP